MKIQDMVNLIDFEHLSESVHQLVCTVGKTEEYFWKKGRCKTLEAELLRRGRIKKTNTGKKASEDSRKKSRAAHLGKHQSPKTKEICREKNKGRIFTVEWLEKLRVAAIGKKHTKETKEKLSKLAKERLALLSPEERKHTPASRHKMSVIQTRLIIEGKVHPEKNTTIKGNFCSERFLRKIYYASSYELKALQLFEFDASVIEYSRCPFSIPYILNDGTEHKYIPDFLVEYSNKNICVIEVKPLVFVHTLVNKAKFIAAENFCLQKGFSFCVWTEKELFDAN